MRRMQWKPLVVACLLSVNCAHTTRPPLGARSEVLEKRTFAFYQAVMLGNADESESFLAP